MPATISLVLTTTYMVLVVPSMTGVPVMPISGTMSVELTSAWGTVVTPWAGSRKLRCQSGEPPPSASKA